MIFRAVPVLLLLSIPSMAEDVLKTPGDFCPMSITHARTAVNANGDSYAVNVKLGADFPCRWNVFTINEWIQLEVTQSRSDSGPFRFTVLPNVSATPRIGVIRIERLHPLADFLPALLFYVHQSGAGCTFTLSGQSVSIPATGGLAAVNVRAPQNCVWTAVASSSWITLPAGIDGYTGDGILGITALSNDSPQPRAGWVNVAGERIQVIQAGTNTPVYYSDVPQQSLFFQHVTAIRNSGVTNGCTPNTFCPGRGITRAEAAAMIVRAVLGTDDFTVQGPVYFPDVGPAHPFFKYVQKMKDLDISRGCFATLDTIPRFCPDDIVSRTDMAALVVRARLAMFQGFIFPDAAAFLDVPQTAAEFPYVQKAKQLGITNGCTESKFCPTAPVTREEAAAFLVRGLIAP